MGAWLARAIGWCRRAYSPLRRPAAAAYRGYDRLLGAPAPPRDDPAL
jgi:hypothetical protein